LTFHWSSLRGFGRRSSSSYTRVSYIRLETYQSLAMLVGRVLVADAAERERFGDRVERGLGDRNAYH
jgi:hypothetical protein